MHANLRLMYSRNSVKKELGSGYPHKMPQQNDTRCGNEEPRCKKRMVKPKNLSFFSGNLSVSDQKLGGKHVENWVSINPITILSIDCDDCIGSNTAKICKCETDNHLPFRLSSTIALIVFSTSLVNFFLSSLPFDGECSSSALESE